MKQSKLVVAVMSLALVLAGGIMAGCQKSKTTQETHRTTTTESSAEPVVTGDR